MDFMQANIQSCTPGGEGSESLSLPQEGNSQMIVKIVKNITYIVVFMAAAMIGSAAFYLVVNMFVMAFRRTWMVG
ncbi:MAG: hypothetical protein PVG39_02255 [Desulfobacteraceae bacterium]|jgi:hypothetical protein